MTLPSRRKRPTTPPSTRQESRASGVALRRYSTARAERGPLAVDSVWLPSALLATLALLITAVQAFGDEGQLQWRRANVARPQATRTFKPTQHYPVRQVNYNDGTWATAGPELAEPHGTARIDAVVVHPAGEPAYRVAQNTPFGDDPADLGRELSEPFDGTGRGFGDMPEPTIPDEIRPVEPIPDTGLPVEPLPFGDQPTIPDTGAELMQPDDDAPPFPDPFERDTTPTLPEDTGTPTVPDTVDIAPPVITPEDEALERRRARASEVCAEELAKLKASTLRDIDLSIRLTGTPGTDLPFGCTLDDGSVYTPRSWNEVTYMWKASGQCHKPLYFENAHLERYGHSWGPGLQPIVSGAHFFTRLPVLPYAMGLKPPCECIYPLGHYRPGNCAPYMIDPIPFTWRAALFEAGAWAGGAAIVP